MVGLLYHKLELRNDRQRESRQRTSRAPSYFLSSQFRWFDHLTDALQVVLVSGYKLFCYPLFQIIVKRCLAILKYRYRYETESKIRYGLAAIVHHSSSCHFVH